MTALKHILVVSSAFGTWFSALLLVMAFYAHVAAGMFWYGVGMVVFGTILGAVLKMEV